MTREEAAQEAWEIAKANGYSKVSASETSDRGEDPMHYKCSLHIGKYTEDGPCIVGENFDDCIAELKEKIVNRKESRIASLRAELAKLEGGQA